MKRIQLYETTTNALLILNHVTKVRDHWYGCLTLHPPAEITVRHIYFTIRENLPGRRVLGSSIVRRMLDNLRSATALGRARFWVFDRRRREKMGAVRCVLMSRFDLSQR